MSALFRRQVRVLLAVPLSSNLSQVSAQVTEIKDLRVVFKVQKALVKDPNTCELKIYNLSGSTRSQLPGTGAKVVVQAGYEGTLAQIFIGDARTIEHTREGADWVTTIRCGDGERALQFARVNTSFGVGAQVSDVITTIGKATKLDVGNLASVAASVPPSDQYTQGYVAHGSAVKELEKALAKAGYELSIQDGAILALAPGESTTEEVIELSPETGLVGSPEMASGEKKEGKNKAPSRPVLKAKSLLQAGFGCGRKVKVISRNHSGLFRVVKLEHSGDTFGGDFYSSLELEARG